MSGIEKMLMSAGIQADEQLVRNILLLNQRFGESSEQKLINTDITGHFFILK